MNRSGDFSTAAQTGSLCKMNYPWALCTWRILPYRYSQTRQSICTFAVAIEVGRRGIPVEATPRPLVIYPQSGRGRPSESFGRVQHICTAMFTTFTRADQICDLQARGLRFTEHTYLRHQTPKTELLLLPCKLSCDQPVHLNDSSANRQ